MDCTTTGGGIKTGFAGKSTRDPHPVDNMRACSRRTRRSAEFCRGAPGRWSAGLGGTKQAAEHIRRLQGFLARRLSYALARSRPSGLLLPRRHRSRRRQGLGQGHGYGLLLGSSTSLGHGLCLRPGAHLLLLLPPLPPLASPLQLLVQVLLVQVLLPLLLLLLVVGRALKPA